MPVVLHWRSRPSSHHLLLTPEAVVIAAETPTDVPDRNVEPGVVPIRTWKMIVGVEVVPSTPEASRCRQRWWPCLLKKNVAGMIGCSFEPPAKSEPSDDDVLNAV